MAGAHRVVFAVIAASLVGLTSAGAVAQLTGPDREIFVKSSIKGCTGTAQRDLPTVPAETMTPYCSCMAGRQADMTTQADLTYFAAHQQLSADYQHRVAELAPDCREAAGLGK